MNTESTSQPTEQSAHERTVVLPQSVRQLLPPDPLFQAQASDEHVSPLDCRPRPRVQRNTGTKALASMLGRSDDILTSGQLVLVSLKGQKLPTRFPLARTLHPS